MGVALFGHKSSSSVSSKLVSPNTALGYLLCGVNLGFDGYTNTVQVGELIFLSSSNAEVRARYGGPM